MPRNNNYSKAKNFKSSIKQLLKFLKPYTFVIILAIICVVASTVFTLIGPNKLSDLTSVVEKGVSINLDVSSDEYNTLTTEHMLTKEGKQYNLVLSTDFSNENLTITMVIKTENGEIPLPPMTANINELKSQGYINFDGMNMGVGFAGDTLQVWINTETKIDLQKIFRICMLLVILYVAAYIVSLIQGLIMAEVNQKVSKDLRTQIANKINRLPLKYFDKNSYGDVLSRITNDVDTIGQSLNNSVSMLIGAGALFVGSLIMMFYTNWIMALSGIAATILGFALMLLIIRKSQKYFIQQQQVLGAVNGFVEEAYSGQEIIKAYNAEQETTRDFEELNAKLYTSSWKSQFFSGLMQPIMGFVGNLGYVVVCIVGAVLVHFGKIDFAVIIAIMIYIRLFTQPLSQLAQGATSLQSTAAASERVFEFLNESELSAQNSKVKDPVKVAGNVEFNHVKFGYDEDKIIIKDFSAKVSAGQKVAIVGPTGAGKTTLVNLLMKFYDLNGGDILIDGTSIHDLTREQMHDMFGMVLQDTWLFNGTIKENLRFNKPDVTDEQIKQACKAAGVHHFVKTLPNGYDTVLDDNTNISAGQKQLLTIARAMIENAPMLILDEATSSVDTRTEILIQQAMDKLTENRTSFVIAHRLSTIKNADIILVLRDGDIVEMGNHNQLLKKGGFYADLYNSQFEEV